MLGNNPRTLNVWFRSEVDAVKPVVSCGTHSVGQLFEALTLSGPTWEGHFWGGPGYETALGGIVPAVTVGQWHMATLVYDGATTVAVYHDGSHVGDYTLSDELNTTLPASPDDRVFVGASAAASGTTGCFGGAIDDVALWDRTLTAAEIATVHEFGELGLGLFDIGKVIPETAPGSPFRASIQRTRSGSVMLTWDSSLPGAVYTVEWSTRLTSWTPLAANIPPSGNLTSLLLPADDERDPGSEPRLFLRVRQVPAVEVTRVDPDPGGSTFQSHNQKVVANDRGIFVSYGAAGYLRLGRSVDGGRNFTTVYQNANAQQPAPMETDEHDNIYLVYTGLDGTGLNFLRFSPANGFAEPIFVRTHAVPLGSKIAMAYDRARQQFYVASQWGAVFTLDKSGNLLRNQAVFGSVSGHVAAYPHLMVDSSGILHFADTTALAGDCIPYVTIRYLRSADGGATWTKMDGTALSLPTSPAPDGPSDMINLPDEVSPYSTWLANFHVRDGTAHFIYRATNPWDPECLGLTTTLAERQHYMRFNAATGVREIDSWAETGGWGGGGTWIGGISGLLASDLNDPGGPLYGVMMDSMWQITSLVSLDNGSTWQFHASTPRGYFVYALGGCRTLTPDGNIIGTFSAGDDQGDWHVYFFTIRGYPAPGSP